MARGTHAWYNGKIVPAETTRISLFTHGLHYGFGTFEGIRAYRQTGGGGAIFRLRDHIERFEDSTRILGLVMPYSTDVLMKACVEVCKANRFEDCYIRPILYVGDGPLGVDPGMDPPLDIAILNWEWGKYLGETGIKEGDRMVTSSFLRPQVNSSMTKGKLTGAYVTGVLAKREAIKRGYSEAFMLDPNGYVAEATGANVFMVKNGIVKTTPLTSILSGITRNTVITQLKKEGHDVREQQFSRDEMWCADEVFLTGTAAEITPVREIDDRTIGRGPHAGKPGPVTAKLQETYHKMVSGTLPEWGKHWLTPV